MISYIIRRALYAIPILIGVNVITFILFFVVNSPDDMAMSQLGQKHTTEQQIEDWKRERGYHLPLFVNEDSMRGRLNLLKRFFIKNQFVCLYSILEVQIVAEILDMILVIACGQV